MAPHTIVRQLLKQLHSHHDNGKGSTVDQIKIVPVEDLSPKQRQAIEQQISNYQLDGDAHSSSNAPQAKTPRRKRDIALKTAAGAITFFLCAGAVTAVVLLAFGPVGWFGVPIVSGIVVFNLLLAGGLLFATRIDNTVEFKRMRVALENMSK